MKQIVVFAALSVLWGIAYAQQPLEIKGLKIGETVDCTILNDVDIRQGDFYGMSTPEGCWSKDDDIDTSMMKVSFLGYGDQTMIYGVRPDGILALLTLTSKAKYDFQELPWDFDDAVAAFTQKYGEPDEVVNSVGENAFGAQFPQKKATWRQGTQELSVGESLSTVGGVTVTLSDETLSWTPQASDDI